MFICFIWSIGAFACDDGGNCGGGAYPFCMPFDWGGAGYPFWVGGAGPFI